MMRRRDRHLHALAALPAAIGLAFSPGASGAQPAGSLTGLWGTQLSFTPGLAGMLEISRRENIWSATLAGKAGAVQRSGDRINVTFQKNGGSFNGRVVIERHAIEGFWIQPAGASDPRDPYGSNQPLASPLVLTASGAQKWHGAVKPMPDTFTLFLKIFPSPDGTLLAAFRNPQANSNGGASQFRVTTEMRAVHFSAPVQGQPRVTIDATMQVNPDRLRMSWSDIGRVVELHRLSPAQASAFYPRPPGSPPYAYRKPEDAGDGWQTARAGDVGLDETKLAGIVQRFIDVDPAAARPALLHSLVVAFRGKLVLDEYFYGYTRSDPHDLRSAGKTFASVMLGAAMLQGLPLSPDSRVYAVLSGLGPFANPDPQKQTITLAQLLTHTSGLACDDNDDASPGNEGTMQSQAAQPNWWRYALDLGVVHAPGTRYAYCSAGTNLIGAALTTAGGVWLPEFFDRSVARPLEWSPFFWNLMPNGEGYLGGGSRVRPRDLLKVGQAYLDGGVWHGRRIVDAAWVNESTQQRVEISPATTGLSPDQFSNFYIQGADAYAWHLATLNVGSRSYGVYSATGNGGQVLNVVPDLDLAVAYTAGNYGQGGIWNRFRQQIVGDGVIPAIRP